MRIKTVEKNGKMISAVEGLLVRARENEKKWGNRRKSISKSKSKKKMACVLTLGKRTFQKRLTRGPRKESDELY